MIVELRELQAQMRKAGLYGYWPIRLGEILDSQDTKYADVLKQMAEDERHLRELVDRLEKIVGESRQAKGEADE